MASLVHFLRFATCPWLGLIFAHCLRLLGLVLVLWRHSRFLLRHLMLRSSISLLTLLGFSPLLLHPKDRKSKKADPDFKDQSLPKD